MAASSVKDMKDFYYCIGPGCESGQINEDSDRNPQMRCVECGFDQCVKHLVPWHKGERCKEYDIRKRYESRSEEDRRAEAQTDMYLQTQTRACPHCSTHISKIDGCNDMKCKYSSGALDLE